MPPNTPPPPTSMVQPPAAPAPICPIMTAGMMAPPSGLVDARGARTASQPAAFCVGNRCAFWLGLSDEAGRPSGGACCLPVLAQAASQLQNLMLPVARAHAAMLQQAQVEPQTSVCAECQINYLTERMMITQDNRLLCPTCAERPDLKPKVKGMVAAVHHPPPPSGPPGPTAPANVTQFKKKE